jgi:hypothetical protein
MRGSLLIVLVAALAMVPELAIGLTVTDNFRLNLVWPEQFVELFRAGHLYPRWLPRCWDGMGSPVFYFYPPLFFWVASLVGTATGGLLAPERFVPLATLTVLAASGLSMRAWLRTVASDRRATIGAIAYMVAPYHLYDLYGRGALAEACGYAVIPLVMLALTRLGQGRMRFIPVLALSFAALLFSHLPIALLAGLFLIAPYALFVALRSERPLPFLVAAPAGGLIGIMLASAFVLPALTLLPYASPAALTGSFYRPENWFFWHVHAGSMSARMLLIIPVTIAASLLAVTSVAAARGRSPRRDPLFWGWLTIALAVLVAGVPIVWQLPGLSLVQFPWRALVLVEFATVTLLVLAPPKKNLLMVSGVAVLGFAYLVLGMVAGHMIGRTWNRGHQSAAEIRSEYQDAPEYLPAGTRITQGEGPDDTHVVLPRVPLASATNSRAKVVATNAPDGGMTITVDTPEPTVIGVGRFYFPHWRAQDSAGRTIPVAPDPAKRNVTFRVPSGETTVRLRLGHPPVEILGRLLTLIALGVVGFIVAAQAWAARPRRAGAG